MGTEFGESWAGVLGHSTEQEKPVFKLSIHPFFSLETTCPDLPIECGGAGVPHGPGVPSSILGVFNNTDF